MAGAGLVLLLTPYSVNSIFNPAFIDSIYPKSSAYRRSLLDDARATNYGVVRLELIEHLYERMYHQHRELGPDETQWPHRIMGGRRILQVDELGDGFRLRVCLSGDDVQDGPLLQEEVLDVDLIISATGYSRTAHVDMLKETWPLLPDAREQEGREAAGTKDRWLVESERAGESGTEPTTKSTRVMEVGRNYGVRFSPNAVASGSGIWLQGCCEGTHGVSADALPPLLHRNPEANFS